MSYRIDEPCTENWDAMEPKDGGRFCQSCEHVVIDATNMTKREFDAHFEATSGGVCAQFRANPVGDGVFRRDLPRPRSLGSFVLLSTLLASACGTEAPAEPAQVAAIEPVEEVSAEEPAPIAQALPEEAAPEVLPTQPIAAPAALIRPTPSTRMGGVRRH
jgi:hypothetical protein